MFIKGDKQHEKQYQNPLYFSSRVVFSLPFHIWFSQVIPPPQWITNPFCDSISDVCIDGSLFPCGESKDSGWLSSAVAHQDKSYLLTIFLMSPGDGQTANLIMDLTFRRRSEAQVRVSEGIDDILLQTAGLRL